MYMSFIFVVERLLNSPAFSILSFEPPDPNDGTVAE